MAIVSSNGLTGQDGVQPTSATFADSGDVPASLDNTGMLYSDDVQIRGRNSILLRTNLTRQTSSRFSYPVGSGPWTVRFYAQSPPMSTDFDINERRMLLEWGSQGLMWRESAARNVVQRLQDVTLINQNNSGEETGNAVSFDQLVRFEVMYDGSGTLTSRIYPGNSTTSFRQNVWSHTPGTTLTFSGMRWYNYSVLQDGSTDANSDGQVTPLQQGLVDLGYTVAGGVDGFYGSGTADAVSEFQSDNGLTANGIAGAETRTALELALRLQSDPNDYPDPMWIGNLTITDTAEWIGPLDLMETVHDTTVDFNVDIVAEDTSVAARSFVEFDPQASSLLKEVSASSTSGVEFDTAMELRKEVSADSSNNVEFETSITHTATSFIPDPPEYPVQFEFWVYSPNGDLRGALHDLLSWDVSVPRNDVGSMNIRVTAHSADEDLLTPPFEIALRLRPSNEENFIEPPGCRFISLRRTRDYADRSGVYTWTLANYSWMLNKIKSSGRDFTGTTKTFENMPVGRILYEVTRDVNGDLPALNFTSLRDSNNETWPTASARTLDVTWGSSLFTLLKGFSDDGLLDWRFQARTWQVYRAGGGMTGEVALPALNWDNAVLEFTETLSYEDYASGVMASSPQPPSAYVFFASSRPDRHWGAWFNNISLPGVQSGNDISAAGNSHLDDVYNPVPQVVARIPLLRTEAVPLYHYNPGQSIRVTRPNTDSTPDYLRVEQVTLTNSGDRTTEAIITFMNRFPSRDAKMMEHYRASNMHLDAILGNRAFVPSPAQ